MHTINYHGLHVKCNNKELMDEFMYKIIKPFNDSLKDLKKYNDKPQIFAITGDSCTIAVMAGKQYFDVAIYDVKAHMLSRVFDEKMMSKIINDERFLDNLKFKMETCLENPLDRDLTTEIKLFEAFQQDYSEETEIDVNKVAASIESCAINGFQKFFKKDSVNFNPAQNNKLRKDLIMLQQSYVSLLLDKAATHPLIKNDKSMYKFIARSVMALENETTKENELYDVARNCATLSRFDKLIKAYNSDTKKNVVTRPNRDLKTCKGNSYGKF